MLYVVIHDVLYSTTKNKDSNTKRMALGAIYWYFKSLPQIVHKIDMDVTMQRGLSLQQVERHIRRVKCITHHTSLLIENEQTGELYTDEDEVIPKNVSLCIKRVPRSQS